MSVVINVKREIGGFDFAGSRGSGEIIRKKIKPILDEGDKVTLDFVGINGITQSFADEIFGIFIRAFGVGYIKDKLLIVNANENIRKIINFVVSYSKKRTA
ncbi:STAS-like domain-containing protein [Nitrosophilus labii]|uniref:STAS-like domain-containing protein n=1 Tax=Nitrosophilus labii TaxID=2706014 RepID=UPI001656C4E8|nr:STAS-like domain-containing protein [Nitrosophilus labii]